MADGLARWRAVRTAVPVTAARALAWVGGDGLGYALAPARASWFTVAGGVASAEPGGPDPLDGAFELVARVGALSLRWVQSAGGAGTAIALTDAPDGVLPEGVPVAGAERFTFGEARQRLAGRVAQERDGWSLLRSAQVGQAWVPVEAAVGSVIDLRSSEIATEDEFGNVAVVDAVLVGLEEVDDDR